MKTEKPKAVLEGKVISITEGSNFRNWIVIAIKVFGYNVKTYTTEDHYFWVSKSSKVKLGDKVRLEIW